MPGPITNASPLTLFGVAQRGMSAQLVRMNAASSNLANAGSVASSEAATYRPVRAVFAEDFDRASGLSTVRVSGVLRENSAPIKEHSPHHPLADANGDIWTAPVDENAEMTEMLDASRQYQNLVEALPPTPNDRATMMAAIEMIEVSPAESAAKVVVNSRTGTVVINSAVKLYPAAISHGKLTVRIDESPQVFQPGPLSRGQTAVQQDSKLTADEDARHVVLFKPGASLARLVDALNLLGVTPSDLVAILEALKEAGALKAEIEVI